MTKLPIFLLVSLLLSGNTSIANGLVVYFEGVLVPLGCHLTDDDAQKKIYLSGLRFSTIENYGHSDTQSFQLDIADCSKMALDKTIKITLSTQNIETHSGISYLKTTGDSNVLLALTDTNGQEIQFNKPIDISTVIDTGKGSLNTLSFGVYAQKPFNAPLKTGSFSSMVTFSLDYQ